MTICDKFELTIIDGQLCYSLDIAKLREKPTKSGKENGLFLLLDPNPYQVNVGEKNVVGSRTTDKSFKVLIHTLEHYTISESGSYGMTSLKRMTGTKKFEQLPDDQKKCAVHNREECQTKRYLDQVQERCHCSSWALQIAEDKPQVRAKTIK